MKANYKLKPEIFSDKSRLEQTKNRASHKERLELKGVARNFTGLKGCDEIHFTLFATG